MTMGNESCNLLFKKFNQLVSQSKGSNFTKFEFLLQSIGISKDPMDKIEDCTMSNVIVDLNDIFHHIIQIKSVHFCPVWISYNIISRSGVKCVIGLSDMRNFERSGEFNTWAKRFIDQYASDEAKLHIALNDRVI